MTAIEHILEAVRGKKVYLRTYGCTYNAGDSVKLSEILRSQGCTFTDSSEKADAIIVNTCTVIGPTERKVLKYLKQNRDRQLFVTGCMPIVQKQEIEGVCTPQIIPPDEIQDLYCNIRTVPRGPIGIVQVATGCLGTCTYCITRRARGKLKSFPRHDILDQIRRYIREGAIEIRLTAQDAGCWGADLGTGGLPSLLHSITRIPGDFRVRLGMMNPCGIADQIDPLIRELEHEKMFKFIHCPLQSGSDRILEDMKRGYTSGEFIRIVEAFRAAFPEMTLATDVIIGYPGETPKDLSATVRTIETVRPEKIHITRYSHRPGIPPHPAGDLTDYTKKIRSRYLNSVANRVYRENNALWVGRRVPVLVTEQVRPDSVISRTPCYRNVVLQGDLSPGYMGYAFIRSEHLHYFRGALVPDARCE